jgi:bile acid:Na+ symporter, BASS family
MTDTNEYKIVVYTPYLSHDSGIMVILLMILLSSILGGVLFSSVGKILSPYLLFFLGIILFLNLVRMDTSKLLSVFLKPRLLIKLSIVKLIIIPVIMYLLASLLYPRDALPILLLSGISTGLGAPFVVNLFGGNLALIVGTVVTTSISVPFILPILVYIFFQSELSVPVTDMAIILSVALFVPLAAGWATKKYKADLADILGANSMAPSLGLIFLINLIIFSNASAYFFTDQSFVINTTFEAIILFAVYGLFGYMTVGIKGKDSRDKFSGVIAMTYINNILVVVLAQQFFGQQIAALATFYNVPYILGIILLRTKTAYRNSNS